MQEPTVDDQAPIPTENDGDDDPNWKRIINVRRKAAKRTLPFDLPAGELNLVKRLRLEKCLPPTTGEAARKTVSTDVSVGLPPPVADNDYVNADPETDGTTRATGRWTTDEDAQLTRAVANTSNKKWGKEYKTDWPAVAALVPSRTKSQCKSRWVDTLDPSIDRASGRKGEWSEDEDSKLKDAVQTHGDKDWGEISMLVPGRTRKQCCNRWNDVLDPSSGGANGRKGKWSAVEDSKLKHAVQTQGDKDWVAISLLVPGRTNIQCWGRWYDTLDPYIALTGGSKGKWTDIEDSKLKDAVQTHGDKDWVALSGLVPGRTKKQCWRRWHDVLDPNIGLANGRTGKWSAVEDSKLKDAVQANRDKNKGWGVISALVPGRTKIQCCNRWHNELDYSIDRANGRTDKSTSDEHIKLKDATQTQSD
jgi:hypothetical protein